MNFILIGLIFALGFVVGKLTTERKYHYILQDIYYELESLTKDVNEREPEGDTPEH